MPDPKDIRPSKQKTVTCMNSQSLWEHACGMTKSKPEGFPALRWGIHHELRPKLEAIYNLQPSAREKIVPPPKKFHCVFKSHIRAGLSNLKSLSPMQSQLWVPSHGVGLKYNQILISSLFPLALWHDCSRASAGLIFNFLFQQCAEYLQKH